MSKTPRLLLALTGLAGFLAGPGEGSPPERRPVVLRAMTGITQGQWELRMRDGSPPALMCLHSDPRRLIQVKHPDAVCDSLVLENRPFVAVVQYVCRGQGYGRTMIRREGAQLLQLETQGIADGLPFEISGEGRRTGSCGN